MVCSRLPGLELKLHQVISNKHLPPSRDPAQIPSGKTPGACDPWTFCHCLFSQITTSWNSNWPGQQLKPRLQTLSLTLWNSFSLCFSSHEKWQFPRDSREKLAQIIDNCSWVLKDTWSWGRFISFYTSVTLNFSLPGLCDFHGDDIGDRHPDTSLTPVGQFSLSHFLSGTHYDERISLGSELCSSVEGPCWTPNHSRFFFKILLMKDVGMSCITSPWFCFLFYPS